MTAFCKYRHVFGKEKEGIHSYRVFNIAIVDLLATLVAAVIISLFAKVNVVLVFFVLMVLSVLLHKLFCVESTLTKTILP
jgi:Flp pilus assembly protein TadB